MFTYFSFVCQGRLHSRHRPLVILFLHRSRTLHPAELLLDLAFGHRNCHLTSRVRAPASSRRERLGWLALAVSGGGSDHPPRGCLPVSSLCLPRRCRPSPGSGQTGGLRTVRLASWSIEFCEMILPRATCTTGKPSPRNDSGRHSRTTTSGPLHHRAD